MGGEIVGNDDDGLASQRYMEQSQQLCRGSFFALPSRGTEETIEGLLSWQTAAGWLLREPIYGDGNTGMVVAQLLPEMMAHFAPQKFSLPDVRRDLVFILLTIISTPAQARELKGLNPALFTAWRAKADKARTDLATAGFPSVAGADWQEDNADEEETEEKGESKAESKAESKVGSKVEAGKVEVKSSLKLSAAAFSPSAAEWTPGGGSSFSASSASFSPAAAEWTPGGSFTPAAPAAPAAPVETVVVVEAPATVEASVETPSSASASPGEGGVLGEASQSSQSPGTLASDRSAVAVYMAYQGKVVPSKDKDGQVREIG